MDYKRILICVILFSLLIATTNVAFASNDTNIVIDDDSDDYIYDEIEDINDEYEYSIWDYLQIEVTPYNEDFNAEDNFVWDVTIKNNANSTFENLNLALYIIDPEEPEVCDITYLNFTKGILGDSGYYFPVPEYLAIGSFNPGETAEIYVQTMSLYPEEAYLMCHFLNSNNECTGDLSDFELEDYDNVGFCFDISMADVDDSDEFDEFDDEFDDFDDFDDFDGFDYISDLEKYPSYGILVPSRYIGNDAYQSVQPQMEYGYAIAGKSSHHSEIILPNDVAKNIDLESVEELTENIPKDLSSVSDEGLINGFKSINNVVSYDSANNMVDNVINTVVQSVSSNAVSSIVFNSEVQSENQDTSANDINNADNNVMNNKVVKTADNSSSGINYGIIGLLLIAIICIVVAYRKFN